MDLFIDRYYENEVENKLNYHQLLYGTSTPNLTPELTFINCVVGDSFRTGNVLIIVKTPIDNVHVKNGEVHLQEFKIANNMKRFTLESL
jgi:hypothetical protein